MLKVENTVIGSQASNISMALEAFFVSKKGKNCHEMIENSICRDNKTGFFKAKWAENQDPYYEWWDYCQVETLHSGKQIAYVGSIVEPKY